MRKKIRRILCSVIAVIQIVSLFTALTVHAAPYVAGFMVSVDPDDERIYAEGEIFDPSPYVGKLIYSDDSIETVSSALMTCKIDTPLTADTSTAVFSTEKDGKTYTAEKSVKVLPLAELVPSGAYKTDYYAGDDTFDAGDLTFTAVFRSSLPGYEGLQIVKEIPSSAVTLSAGSGDYLTSADTYITASYSIGSSTVSCNLPVSVKGVSQIIIEKSPQGYCYEGEVLSYEDEELVVKALYEGESESRTVTNYTVLGLANPVVPEFDENEGMYYALYTVEFDGKYEDFTVPALCLYGSDYITATSSTGIQHIYPHLGDKFDENSITVTALYDDGSSDGLARNVTDFTVFTYPETFVYGDTVTAEFAGYQVDMSEAVKVHTATFDVAQHSAKTQYKEGDTYSSSGFMALIRLDDGTFVHPALSSLTLTAPDPLPYTASYVTYSWYGLEYRESITVTPAKQVTVSVNTVPATIKYYSGQPITIEGLKINLKSEGEAATVVTATDIYSAVPSTGCITTVPAVGEPASSGMTSVLVRYYVNENVYSETSFPIAVEEKTVSGISVSEYNDIIYDEGDKYKTSQMVLNLFYNDGTSVKITSGFTVSTDPLILQSDSDAEYEIIQRTVTYGNFTCLVNVKVRPGRIATIAIESQPDKRDYNEGSFFDPTGMKVVISFVGADQTAVYLPDSYYTYTPTGRLSASDKTVTVSFRGVTATTQIYVTSAVTQTAAPETTKSPETTKTPETTEKAEVTTSPEVTTGSGSNGNSSSVTTRFLPLWIIIIVIIVAGIVVLIIYYKRNFT